MRFLIAGCTAALLLSACAALPAPRTVLASAETAPAPEGEVQAGSVSLWVGGSNRLPDGLTRSGFVAATNRSGGIAVYDAEGRFRQAIDGPRLIELDTAALPLADAYTGLIGGVYRSGRQTRLIFHRADHGQQEVRRWGEVALGLAEPLGFCMRQVETRIQAVVFDRRGEVRIVEVSEGPDGEVQSAERGRFRIDTPGPGCAIDTMLRQVWFSGGRGGFVRASLSESPAPVRIEGSAPHRLPRSLGVSYLNSGRDRFLTTVDEYRTAFSVWRLERDAVVWVGRFAVREDPDGRPARSVGGIEAYGGAIPGFEDGVVIVQDQANNGAPNLKFVRWSDVRTALGFRGLMPN